MSLLHVKRLDDFAHIYSISYTKKYPECGANDNTFRMASRIQDGRHCP